MSATTTVNMFLEALKLGLYEGVHTAAGWFWTIVKTTWVSYWPFILGFLIIWVFVEIITRNGNMHYNSLNGFSPTFNRFVGSGTLMFFQWLTYYVIEHLFTKEVYLLHLWPYPVHILSFALTGLFLNLIGFWVYLKAPSL